MHTEDPLLGAVRNDRSVNNQGDALDLFLGVKPLGPLDIFHVATGVMAQRRLVPEICCGALKASL
jgi:hypothetical protein